MKNLLTAALPFIFVGAANAQSPTITSANFLPVVGEIFNSYATTEPASGEGTAGVNQVWNFGAIPNTGSLDPSVVIPVAGSPYAASNPNANLCVRGGALPNTTYGYYQTNSTDFITLGLYVGTSAQLTYTNPETIVHFPLTYNSTYTDTYATTINSSGSIFYRTGTMTSLVDGYGTLTTPIGTYTNVLRVKLTDVFNDTFNGTPAGTYNQVSFLYYKAGTHNSLLSFTHSNNNGTASKSGSYLQSVTVNTEEAQLASQLNMSVFPNPSQGTASAKIKLSLLEASECTVSIYDAIGMQVASQNMGELAAGEQVMALPTTNELAKGIYFVRVQTKQGFATTKMTIN